MELLLAGSTLINDTVVRALPTVKHRMFVTAITATSIDISNNSDMSNAKNLLPADPSFGSGGQEMAAGFIRVNGGSANVRLVKG
jgi:hypothetical protein